MYFFVKYQEKILELGFQVYIYIINSFTFKLNLN